MDIKDSNEKKKTIRNIEYAHMFMFCFLYAFNIVLREERKKMERKKEKAGKVMGAKSRKRNRKKVKVKREIGVKERNFENERERK